MEKNVFFRVVVFFLILGNGTFRKDILIETNENTYFARMKGNKSKTFPETGKDYNDDDRLHRCSLKTTGAEKDIQIDVSGCGGKLNIECRDGCLHFLEARYSCDKEGTSIKKQLAIVQDVCEVKENCVLDASRNMFGHSECPETEDSDMNLRVVYRCNGGTESNTVSGEGNCRTVQGPTTAATNNNPACPKVHGRMREFDIVLDEDEDDDRFGWVKLKCDEPKPFCGNIFGVRTATKPCIFIHKARAACNLGPPIKGHMDMIKEICEGKTECEIRPRLEMFNPPVTCRCGLIRELWINYSCDGGCNSHEGGLTSLYKKLVGSAARTAAKMNPACWFG